MCRDFAYEAQRFVRCLCIRFVSVLRRSVLCTLAEILVASYSRDYDGVVFHSRAAQIILVLEDTISLSVHKTDGTNPSVCAFTYIHVRVMFQRSCLINAFTLIYITGL